MTRDELLEKIDYTIDAYHWGTPPISIYHLLKEVRAYLMEEKGDIFPPRTDGIEIRWPPHLNDEIDYMKERRFDIVKWEPSSPILVFDTNESKHVPVKEKCYTIATLVWNEKDKWFDTTTYGTRLLETYLTPAAQDMLSQFIKKRAEKFAEEDLESGNYDG